jgi:hypothetical protein
MRRVTIRYQIAYMRGTDYIYISNPNMTSHEIIALWYADHEKRHGPFPVGCRRFKVIKTEKINPEDYDAPDEGGE